MVNLALCGVQYPIDEEEVARAWKSSGFERESLDLCVHGLLDTACGFFDHFTRDFEFLAEAINARLHGE